MTDAKMQKPRATSDPPPTASPDSYGGQQVFSTTLPARIGVPPRMRMAEPFPAISATMLLSLDDVSHSGWVRKEGYGYRSWKNRFMVLHHGCIYYFKETDSNAPKGKFPLNGFSCLLAEDREGVDRYPYVFKLVPDDKQRRTYYISSPSKSEMEGWMNSINEDIQKFTPSDYDYVDTGGLGKSATCPTVSKNIPIVSKRESNDSPYNRAVFPQSFSTCDVRLPAPLLPPKPYEDMNNDQDDDTYDTVHEFRFPSDDYYVRVLNDEPGGTDSSAGRRANKPHILNNGRPPPPVRPKPPPRPAEMNLSESDGEDSEDEDLYLDLAREQANQKNKSKLRSQSLGSLLKNGPSATSPEKERPIPVPPVPSELKGLAEDNVTEVLYVPIVSGDEIRSETTQPKPPPPPRPVPRKKKSPEEFDYLPSDCWRPDLPKQQAKIFLELGRIKGEYIINCSQTSDTKQSLSVWLGNGVKHYLIFKRQEKYTLDPSLTAEEHFSSLRQLVKYYFNHPLPKSGQYLTMPFAAKQ